MLHAVASWTPRVSSSLAWWMWATPWPCCKLYLLAMMTLSCTLLLCWLTSGTIWPMFNLSSSSTYTLFWEATPSSTLPPRWLALVADFYQRAMLDSSDELSGNMPTRRMILEQQLACKGVEWAIVEPNEICYNSLEFGSGWFNNYCQREIYLLSLHLIIWYMLTWV